MPVNVRIFEGEEEASQANNRLDNAEKDVVRKRITYNAIIPIPLHAEEVDEFVAELEALCNKYLNI